MPKLELPCVPRHGKEGTKCKPPDITAPKCVCHTVVMAARSQHPLSFSQKVSCAV